MSYQPTNENIEDFGLCPKCGGVDIDDSFSRDIYSAGYTYTCKECGNIWREMTDLS